MITFSNALMLDKLSRGGGNTFLDFFKGFLLKKLKVVSH